VSLPPQARPPCARRRSRRRAGERGFTLIELITVVVITSVLAVVALGGFRRRITQAGTLEVRAMIKSIAAAQESFRAEQLVYLDVSDGDLSAIYPMAVPDGKKYHFWGWTHDDAARWRRLAPQTPKPVSFGYATVAGTAGFTDWASLNAGVATTGWATPNEPWYLIRAQGDDDGNGVSATAIASSTSSRIVWQNEGE
jgi:prepilin-type N-terminal cleavage/methylation domain-containing protein